MDTHNFYLNNKTIHEIYSLGDKSFKELHKNLNTNQTDTDILFYTNKVYNFY
jgi:hypothetical protein